MNSINSVSDCKDTKYKTDSNNAYRKCAIDMAATVTTVGCYYPLRTIGSRWIDGLKAPRSFRLLYSGFGYGCVGAHQIFLMAYFNQKIREYYAPRECSLVSQIGIGIFSGILSTPTTVPFEAKTRWMQQVGSTQGGFHTPFPISSYFRGFIPMLWRQAGLSLGMFVFPGLIQKYIQKKFEYYHTDTTYQDRKWVSIVSNIVGGSGAVVLTHIPELARMKMQSIHATSISTKEALKNAWNDAFTLPAKNLFLLRLGVVITATLVMDLSRKVYSQLGR